MVFKERDFNTPLALNCQKGQHLSALEVYKNQSHITVELFYLQLCFLAFLLTIGAFLLAIGAPLLTLGKFV